MNFTTIRHSVKLSFFAFATWILFVVSAESAIRCESVFNSGQIKSSSAQAEQYQLVREYQKVFFEAYELKEISAIADRYKVDSFKDHFDLIDQLFQKVSNDTKLSALEKGESLAQVGLEIHRVLEQRFSSFMNSLTASTKDETYMSMNRETIETLVRTQKPDLSSEAFKNEVQSALAAFQKIRLDLFKARYTLGEYISKLEAFPHSMYKIVDSHPLIDPNYTFVTFKEYPSFAKALALSIPPPLPYGGGGVVSVQVYRDIISHNLWLFTLKGHDLKHIHFAYSHPMATASIFRATRSQNLRRFAMIAGLYEGVDTVQYPYETKIARYFSSEGFKLEEALIFLASATQADLNNIDAAIGAIPQADMNLMAQWVPTTMKPANLPAKAKPLDQLENDILDLFSQSLRDQQNPDLKYMMHPELIPEGTEAPPGTRNKPGDSIHY